MYLTPSKCPVCGEGLAVTRLVCPACEHGDRGAVSLSGPEAAQALEQRVFVEQIVRLRRQAELGRAGAEGLLSHCPQPAGRGDPGDGLRGGRAPPAEEKAVVGEQRQAILDDLAAGKITLAEAIKQLQAV